MKQKAMNDDSFQIIPNATISGLLSIYAKLFVRPISAQIFPPVCCVTHTIFKKQLVNFALARNEVVSIQFSRAVS